MKKIMILFLNILLLIPLWIYYYLFRIIWYDFILVIVNVVLDFLSLHFILGIIDLLPLVVIPLDLVIGFFVTLIVAVQSIIDLTNARATIIDLFKRKPKLKGGE